MAVASMSDEKKAKIEPQDFAKEEEEEVESC
jgi:hypothetical protein